MFANAPSKVSIAKFKRNNIIVSTIGTNTSIGETSFLNYTSARNKSKYKMLSTSSATLEPVTSIAKTQCKLLVLPPQHMKRLPKFIENAVRKEHRIKFNFHLNQGRNHVVLENKEIQRKKSVKQKQQRQLSSERQQQSLLDNMQHLAKDLLTQEKVNEAKEVNEVGNGSKIENVAMEEQSSVAPTNSTTNCDMHSSMHSSMQSSMQSRMQSSMQSSSIDSQQDFVEKLKNIRRKPAQIKTNVYVQPLHVDESTLLMSMPLSPLHQSTRVSSQQLQQQQHANARQGFSLPSMISPLHPMQQSKQDLVGSISRSRPTFLQDVFQHLPTYSKSELNQQRRERLRQHNLGSNSSTLIEEEDVPNLYRGPSQNLRLIVGHLRKYNLNHVPGRYSGTPKQMPAWLTDGARNLKIPKTVVNKLSGLLEKVVHVDPELIRKRSGGGGGGGGQSKGSPLDFL